MQEVGSYFLFDSSVTHDGIRIGTLRIGKGLKKLGISSFCKVQFNDIYVEAVEAGEDYDPSLVGAYTEYLPGCGNLYIHRGSDFYKFFSEHAAAVHLSCEGLMEASQGEEYLDEAAKQYVIPKLQTCPVCGYQARTEEREDAFSVTFLAMDQEVAVRYCKRGGAVEPPEAPGYDGFRFEGWDHPCEGITGDLVVKAVYTKEIPRYQVTVHAVFADGAESGTTTYEAAEGEIITLPQYEPWLPGWRAGSWGQ